MALGGELDGVLRELGSRLDDMVGAVVASRDGLALASTGAEPASSRLAAMAAAVLALGEQAVDAAPDRPLTSAVVRGSGGLLAVLPAGAAGALAVQTGPHPNVGLLQFELPDAAGRLQAVVERKESSWDR